MDRDSDIGWWLAVIVGVLLAIWTGALIFLIVMTLLVGWHRGYSRQAEEARSVEKSAATTVYRSFHQTGVR